MRWLEEKIEKGNLKLNGTFLKSLIIISVLIVVNPFQLSAEAKLSEQAKISILTCGPGEQLYATFGHTALWVSDPINQINEVYNFGTFDFKTSNFYLKFMMGRLEYELELTSFDSFISDYELEGRWVKEQELNILTSIKQEIYDSLNIVLLPGNNTYRYDFFRNNCSTKIIDLVLAFIATESELDSLNVSTEETYRKAMNHYIAGREWLKIGINVLLGPFADQSMLKIQSSYLPENLMQVIGETKFAKAPTILNEGNYKLKPVPEFGFSLIILWGLLFLFVFEGLWAKTTQKTSDVIDSVLFATSALFGLLLMFLWIWSAHVSLHVNLNLLWANPFNFILVWSIMKSRTLITRIYLILYGLLLFFLLINWGRLPQKLPLEIMPVVSAIVFRVVNRIFKFKNTDRILTKNPVV